MYQGQEFQKENIKPKRILVKMDYTFQTEKNLSAKSQVIFEDMLAFV
jgi:hypothetical protein